MNDDYLWDRSGSPDPEVERLEGLLGQFALRRLDLPSPPVAVRSSGPRQRIPWGALAAALLVTLGGLWLNQRPPESTWAVAALGGEPELGGERLRATRAWGTGEWLLTGKADRAAAEAEAIGRVLIEPGSRVRLLRADREAHRLSLVEGRLRAMIFAEPRRFAVETPSALAVDLGCDYVLETDAQGNGLLRVLAGWVGFDWGGRETFVPAGARCRTRAGSGPGTPVFDTAGPAFREALEAVDAALAEGRDPQPELGHALDEARPRDAMSLWHLLPRVHVDDRAAIDERLRALAPPPPSVTREAVLLGDPAALLAWWDALNLDDVTWWRRFKPAWPTSSPADARPSAR